MPRSLASRLLLILSLWLLITLAITGVFLSANFRNNAEKSFQGVLLANAYNLMGELDLDDQGRLIGDPQLGDPRFLKPLSGWYWSVSAANSADQPQLHSPSITGEKLELPQIASNPFSDQFRRTYEVHEEYGVQVQRLEAQLFLGDSDVLYQVLVAGNRDQLEQSVQDFNLTLLKFFLIFGSGTILASYFVVRAGLRPLDSATKGLQRIREGKSESLNGKFPTEIAPLASEINALISANRSVTERARTQVGNLAHALKTPLAVIFNESEGSKNKPMQRVKEQSGIMQAQINNYLHRARISAQKGTITARTEIDPVVNNILRVIRKLSPEIEFTFSSGTQGALFKGEQQDLEEVLGNLLENAGRFAESEVQVSTQMLEDQTPPEFMILVEDDGSGLTKKQRVDAVKRGKRLDETTPGSGLGLSIVRDVADEYSGRFELEESKLGGLCAAVVLPRIDVS